jgi:hypothetical protein
MGDDGVVSAIHALIRFGGHEGTLLSPEMILAALSDAPDVDWRRVGSLCREIGFYYAGTDAQEIDLATAVGAVISAVILSRYVQMRLARGGSGGELAMAIVSLSATYFHLSDRDFSEVLQFIVAEVNGPQAAQKPDGKP